MRNVSSLATILPAFVTSFFILWSAPLHKPNVVPHAVWGLVFGVQGSGFLIL